VKRLLLHLALEADPGLGGCAKLGEDPVPDLHSACSNSILLIIRQTSDADLVVLAGFLHSSTALGQAELLVKLLMRATVAASSDDRPTTNSQRHGDTTMGQIVDVCAACAAG
jgi:hypothetical protein